MKQNQGEIKYPPRDKQEVKNNDNESVNKASNLCSLLYKMFMTPYHLQPVSCPDMKHLQPIKEQSEN